MGNKNHTIELFYRKTHKKYTERGGKHHHFSAFN